MFTQLKNNPNLVVDIVTDDIPVDLVKAAEASGSIGIDIETTGLDWHVDKIASVQAYCKDHPIVIVRVNGNKPLRLMKLIDNEKVEKIFHYAIFDLGFMAAKWGVTGKNISCTKTASRLLDPNNTESHSLRNLLKRYLNIEISKESQMSDWSAPELTEQQIEYAAKDVLHLQSLLIELKKELKSQKLWELAKKCFEHIPTRVFLNINGYSDIYLHK